MAAINEADHRRFMERMKEQASVEQRKLVLEELRQLKQLYADYHAGIEQLHQLADDYRSTCRSIKQKLRQQQKAWANPADSPGGFEQGKNIVA